MYNLDTFFEYQSKKISLSEAINTLICYFYNTREFEVGLTFVDICRDLLNKYTADIPFIEAQHIEYDITFMKLNLYDYLNQWQQYLDFFEYIFLEKRSKLYIATYYSDPNQDAKERFGRYLFSCNYNELQVHKLFLHEDRRAIIERKLIRQKLGKNVEHLKRHQKEQLSDEDYLKRIEEMEQLIECMKKYT